MEPIVLQSQIGCFHTKSIAVDGYLAPELQQTPLNATKTHALHLAVERQGALDHPLAVGRVNGLGLLRAHAVDPEKMVESHIARSVLLEQLLFEGHVADVENLFGGEATLDGRSLDTRLHEQSGLGREMGREGERDLQGEVC